MGKRRKLSFIESRTLRQANRSGWADYRYGSAAPVSLPRIFTGEARKAKVDKVKDVLRDWTLSPFEHEGPTRAGIRAGLCLDGHDWRQADIEAEALVSEALHLMGAKRPTWIQGQPEYVIGKENCATCRGPLDEEAIASRDRFCCDECRQIMRARSSTSYHYAMADRARWAYEVTRKEGIPERACGWCGTMFKPAGMETETCSTDCREKLQRSRLKNRVCRNCDEVFKPSKPHQKYCCLECNIEAQAEKGKAERAARLEPRKCVECEEVFEPRTMRHTLCSKRCKDRVSYRRRAAVAPKKERQPAEPRACIECATVFAPLHPAAVFCSIKCGRRFRYREGPAKRLSNFLCEEVKEAA